MQNITTDITSTTPPQIAVTARGGNRIGMSNFGVDKEKYSRTSAPFDSPQAIWSLRKELD